MVQVWERLRVGVLVLFWPVLTPVWYVRHVFSGKDPDRNVLIVAGGGILAMVAVAGPFFADGWWRVALPVVGLPAYLRLMVVQSRQVLDLQKNPLRPEEIASPGHDPGAAEAQGPGCARGPDEGAVNDPSAP